MFRRHLPVFLALALWGGHALALEIQPYSEARLGSLQAAQKPVAVHFHAPWCPTCVAQERSLKQLQAEPGLDVTVLVADYDTEKALRKRLNVRVQSTLVVFRGATETQRVGGVTEAAGLRAALATATAGSR
ncbi:thioredoxin family protein [Aquariibacter albus]|uniref:Thioredoxin family protein n=1 Tax=Aquariibacter albus TaxID=2759899 RepID=A0A839HJA1_9BURK|nr:thioredoxin family protein [Aquariibacter albus]MBB1162455.1 thioredoxin family protein [Aquariibacter albus]